MGKDVLENLNSGINEFLFKIAMAKRGLVGEEAEAVQKLKRSVMIGQTQFIKDIEKLYYKG